MSHDLATDQKNDSHVARAAYGGSAFTISGLATVEPGNPAPEATVTLEGGDFNSLPIKQQIACLDMIAERTLGLRRRLHATL